MRFATPLVRTLAVTIPLLAATAADARQGNVVRANTGDTVLIEGDARVRVVRRRAGFVRIVFNAEQRWLIVLADYPDRTGATDGRVDAMMNYREIDGNWPIEPRWEGQAVLEEYSLAGGPMGPGRGLGLRLPQGLIQLVTSIEPSGAGPTFRDPSALAVLSHRGSGTGGLGTPGSGRFSFDEEEQRAIANVSAGSQEQFRTGATGGVIAGSGGGSSALQPGPPRTGGTVRTPAKTLHVDPVLPEQARQAGVRGVVVVEAIVDADGSVKQARVLRSIPLLDEAALEAVRQWRFEPTLLNGQPVPVIMTLTVNFQ
jgi:TonB family protein